MINTITIINIRWPQLGSWDNWTNIPCLLVLNTDLVCEVIVVGGISRRTVKQSFLLTDPSQNSENVYTINYTCVFCLYFLDAHSSIADLIKNQACCHFKIHFWFDRYEQLNECNVWPASLRLVIFLIVNSTYFFISRQSDDPYDFICKYNHNLIFIIRIKIYL